MSTVAAEKPPAAIKKVPFYINRNYAFLWSGQAISNLGDLIFDTTLTLWIATVIAKGQSWAPLATGGAVLCMSILTFIVGPLAGVFVDRWDKRKTMIRMDVIRAALVALLILVAIPLPFLPGAHVPAVGQLAAIYIVIVLTTACSLFFNPARMTIIQDVVSEPELERASGLALFTQNTSRIVGPAIAAPLLFVLGLQWALLINALSFVISAYAVKWVRVSEQKITTTQPSQKRSSFWHEMNEGLLFLLKNRLLLVMLIALSFIIIGESAEQTLGVFFMLTNLHIPTEYYGIIGTVGGGGGILGALGASYVARKIGAVRSFWMGVTLFGILFFFFSRMTSFIPALIIIFLVGFPIAAANIGMGPLLLRTIPRELLGRVIAVFTTCTSVISIIAVSIVSATASVLNDFHLNLWGIAFGPYDTIFAGCGLLTVIVGLGVGLAMRGIVLNTPESQAQS